MFSFLLSVHIFILIIAVIIILLLAYKPFKELFFATDDSINPPLTQDDFFQKFEDTVNQLEEAEKSKRWKELIDKAWNIRSFEIELFWKRTNFYWLFQAATFTAYFLLSSRAEIQSFNQSFVVICLGIIFSVSWILINKGSKQWQEHWEAYIDLFEDKYYGPIYKTVAMQKTHSVSKINELVSITVLGVWSVFFIEFLSRTNICPLLFCEDKFNPVISYTILFTILMILSLTKGYAKSIITKSKHLEFYSRDSKYKS